MEINLFTNQIINKGEFNEALVLKIPGVGDKFLLVQQPNVGCMIIKSDSSALSYISKHGLINYSNEITMDGLNYIIRASVYTLFSHCSKCINTIMKNQKDLTNSDKEILDGHISRYIKRYCSANINTTEYNIRDKILYDSKLCRLEVRNNHLVIRINQKSKTLIDDLLYFIDPENLSVDKYILELIIRYEMYLEYGLHVPDTVFGAMLVDSPGTQTYIVGECAGYVNQSFGLKSHLLRALSNNKISLNETEVNPSDISAIVNELYYGYPENMIDLYINYWIHNSDTFLQTYFEVIEDYNRQENICTEYSKAYNEYEKQLLEIIKMTQF